MSSRERDILKIREEVLQLPIENFQLESGIFLAFKDQTYYCILVLINAMCLNNTPHFDQKFPNPLGVYPHKYNIYRLNQTVDVEARSLFTSQYSKEVQGNHHHLHYHHFRLNPLANT